jgi:hypothetical protein
VPPCHLEHAHRPDDVDVRVEVRTFHGDAHVRLRREVEARVRPRLVEDAVRVRADVRLVERGTVREVLALPGGEVVEDVHLVGAGEQRLDDVRADEARTSCDHGPHGRDRTRRPRRRCVYLPDFCASSSAWARSD